MSHPPRRRLGARLLALSTLTVLGLAVPATAALAHVTVGPASITAGTYSVLAFKVPNESATAKTSEVAVTLPSDHPFASVSARQLPGWTATLTRTKLQNPVTDDDNATITEAVTTVTWRADASSRIALGQYVEFDLSVGPVPDVRELSFPAVQTYDDGTVVRWNQPTPASGEEPEHPVPTLAVTPAAASSTAPGSATSSPGTGAAATSSGAASSSSGADTAAAGPTVTVTATPAAAAGDSDGAARTLGVVGIVVGAAGALLAAVALRSRRGGAGS
ncbi:YcnI family copper-binding membrane protein [Nakamurella endophytica]|uniref:YncI copper-binding domain-containing protein n=1 Tax=Nakamurella endophytica TaxID=1748367 RepID=A0A917T4L1_9ACTN|nr:YcnI family protein [Nakamurella endophytica]GGM10443.1 hypothetical protein GCM10011594_32930 [Nakamurella endophytica]